MVSLISSAKPASNGSSSVGAGPAAGAAGAAPFSCWRSVAQSTREVVNALGPSRTTRRPLDSNDVAPRWASVESKRTASVSVVMSMFSRSATRWISWSCPSSAMRPGNEDVSVWCPTLPSTSRPRPCWKVATACAVTSSKVPVTSAPTICWIVRIDSSS